MAGPSTTRGAAHVVGPRALAPLEAPENRGCAPRFLAALPTPQRRYVDVRFRTATTVRHVAFRNHFAAAVSVKARLAAPTEGADVAKVPWTTLRANVRLMHNVHAEDESQRWHVITLGGDDDDDGGVQVTAVRVYLEQPSPRWGHVATRLDHVACYAAGATAEEVLVHHKLQTVGWKPSAIDYTTADPSPASPPPMEDTLAAALAAAGRALLV